MPVYKTREFAPGDRYRYDSALSPARGWCQLDSRQDAGYHGNWCNPLTLELFAYCEGDTTATRCDTAAEFVAEVTAFARWNVRQGYGLPGIDSMLVESLAARLAELRLVDSGGYRIAPHMLAPHQLAAVVADSFESGTRRDACGTPSGEFRRVKDNAAPWVRPIVDAAASALDLHGADDFTFRAVESAAERLRELEHDDAETFRDDADRTAGNWCDAGAEVVDAELLDWLETPAFRGLADETRAELGATDSIMGDVRQGYRAALAVVWSSVVESVIAAAADDAETPAGTAEAGA